MNLIQHFLTRNPSFTNGRRIVPQGIGWHSIGVAQPDAMVIINRQNNASAVTSYHGMVCGATDRQIQTLPYNARGWHIGNAFPGGPSANDTHIGLAMSEPNTIRYTGQGAQFVDNNPTATRAFVHRTYWMAVAWSAHLCVEFGWDPLQDGRVIITHSEAHRLRIGSNHADVEHLWSRHGLTLAQFRRDIRDAMRTVTQPTIGVEIPPTRFLTTAASLNCRQAPNTSAGIVGTFSRYTEVIATRENNGWFFVSTGAVTGWSFGGYLSRIVDCPEYNPEEEVKMQLSRSEFNQWFAEETENRNRALSQLPPSSWAEEVWARLTAASITDGSAPQRPMTRQEGLVLIDRMIKAMGIAPAAFVGCLLDHNDDAAPVGEPFEEFGG